MKKKFENAVANIIAYTLFFGALAVTGASIFFPVTIAIIKFLG